MSYLDPYNLSPVLEKEHGEPQTTNNEKCQEASSYNTPDKPTIFLVDSPGKESKSTTFKTTAPAPIPAGVRFPLPHRLDTLDGVEIRDTYKRRRCGVFAKRYFGRGEYIIVERPLFSCGRQRTLKGERWPVAREWRNLPEEDQLKLRNGFRKLRSIPIGKARLGWYWKKRIKNFFIEYAFSSPKKDQGHVYAMGSHMNHACMSCANVEQWTESTAPNRILARVVRPVRPNEEVLIYYNSRRGASLSCPKCGSKGLRDRLGDICRNISRLFSRVENSRK